MRIHNSEQVDNNGLEVRIPVFLKHSFTRDCGKKSAFYIMVILLLLITTTSCTHEEDKITIVFDTAPANLDPHLRREIVRLSILGNIYETLVAFDANMKMVPCLAEYWEKIDSLSTRFYLRNDVIFHNNKKLTAQDVFYSLYRPLKMIESEYAYYRNYLDTIIIDNDNQFTIKLKHPYTLLLYDLAAVFIVPENFDPGYSKPCGTGPYCYVKGDNSQMILKYFPAYREKNISVKEVHFYFAPEPEKRTTMLRDKQADIITFVPLDMLEQIKDGGNIVSVEGVATRYLEMDLRKFPFNKKEFRQAINLAINRERLVNEIYHGYATPANQYIPQGLFGFDYTLPLFVYNPDSAIKLLRNLGNLPEIELDFASVRTFIGHAIIDDLKSVGLKIKANVLPVDQYWQKIESRSSKFYLIGSVPNSNEGISTLYGLFHTYSPERGWGIQNRTGYSNPTVDSLVEETVKIADIKKATQMLIKTQQTILADLPKIPIVWEKEIYGVSNRIQWIPRLDEQIIVKEIKLRK